MFDKQLHPMYNDSVLMNCHALADEAINNVLKRAEQDNFVFKNVSQDHITVNELCDSWRQPYDVIHDGALGDYPEECGW